MGGHRVDYRGIGGGFFAPGLEIERCFSLAFLRCGLRGLVDESFLLVPVDDL